MELSPTHIPVLLKEVMELLDVQKSDIYLDATLGVGGHAEAIFKKIGQDAVIAGIDADSDAVEAAKARLEAAGAKPKFGVLNFRNIGEVLETLEILKPSKILFDLGWNKSQLEESGRGFSFQKDEPLLMTFASPSDKSNLTAYDIVNFWEEDNIETIIRAYGEERFAGKIAKKIVEARKNGFIKTTAELVKIIKDATPLSYHERKIHPATRTFQALRITVNDELRALEDGLRKAFGILKKDGRLAVISFHSLEDRIVKKFFKLLEANGKAEILTKKPVMASQNEIKENPRSRSAKLRGIRKTII